MTGLFVALNRSNAREALAPYHIGPGCFEGLACKNRPYFTSQLIQITYTNN